MAGSLTSTPSSGLAATSGQVPAAQSTPVSSRGGAGQASLLTTPGPECSTPKMSKFSPGGTRGQGEAPRTPTPFKRALGELYRGREPLSNTPQTPTKRMDDLEDIINKDMKDMTDISFTRGEQDALQDSGYGGTDKRPRQDSGDPGDKENSSPNKKVRLVHLVKFHPSNILFLFVHICNTVILGCEEGARLPLVHPRFAAQHDVRWGWRGGPVHPEPRDPEQVAAGDGHLQLAAVQPAQHPQGEHRHPATQ